MRTNIVSFMVIIIFYSISGLCAQESSGSFKVIIDNFFKLYEEGKTDEALDDFYSHNPWSENIRDDIQQVKSQLAGLIKLVGEYNGKEVVYTDDFSGKFVYIKYMLLYDRQPIAFNFTLYKPKDKWIAYSYSYDTQLGDLLEEKAKLNYYYDR